MTNYDRPNEQIIRGSYILQCVCEVTGDLVRVDSLLVENEGVESFLQGAFRPVVDLVSVADASQVVERRHGYRERPVANGLHQRFAAGHRLGQHALETVDCYF